MWQIVLGARQQPVGHKELLIAISSDYAAVVTRNANNCTQLAVL